MVCVFLLNFLKLFCDAQILEKCVKSCLNAKKHSFKIIKNNLIS